MKTYSQMTAHEYMSASVPTFEHNYPRHPLTAAAKAGDLQRFLEVTKQFTYDMSMTVCGIADKAMMEANA